MIYSTPHASILQRIKTGLRPKTEGPCVENSGPDYDVALLSQRIRSRYLGSGEICYVFFEISHRDPAVSNTDNNNNKHTQKEREGYDVRAVEGTNHREFNSSVGVSKVESTEWW